MPDVKLYLIGPFWAAHGPLPALFIGILFDVFLMLIVFITMNILAVIDSYFFGVYITSPIYQKTRHKYKGLRGFPDSKVHGAHMGPIWGRQDPSGPHVGPMTFAICVTSIWITSNDCGNIHLTYWPLGNLIDI